jgi:hypothetical protein
MSTSLESDEEQREAAQLWSYHRSPWGRFQYQFGRLFVRTARVIVGAVLGFVAYWIGTFTTDIIHRPIASLSIADIAEVVLCAIAALGLFCAAFLIAFGGFKSPASAYDFMGEARRRVHERTAERERLAKYYAKSRFWGILHDPKLGQKNSLRANLMWILIVVAGYATIGLIAWASSRTSASP